MRHILDLASKPARLTVRNRLLCIECEADPEVTVPLAEVAAVVLSHPQITCTQAVLAELAQAGAALITCDARHMPAGMMMPLYGYHAPAQRLAVQAGAAKPTCKRVWQQIVRAKITAQADWLIECRGGDFGLLEIAAGVQSGDPTNAEGLAARIYWHELFGDDFTRDFEAEDGNRFLNYGYAILRAIVCRAICAAGLHPGIGVHHHHRANPFCLADDLMEPLRPIVDRNVVRFVAEHGTDAPMDKLTKAHLLSITEERVRIQEERRTLFDVAELMASSLAQVFEGVRHEMILPEDRRHSHGKAA